MNRFFTCADLFAEYRLPQHVYNQLFVEVVPVEKTDQGKPLYLEAHGDAWLTARYSVAPWRSGCGIASTDSHKGEHAESPKAESASAIPVVSPLVKSRPRTKPGDEVGFRFFPR